MNDRPTATLPLDTPIGRLVLECDGDVLDRRLAARRAAARVATSTPYRRYSKETATQLEEYFAGDRTDSTSRWSSTAPVPARGLVGAAPHPLRRDDQLWRAGPTGRRPKGPRAVGQANGRNPIPIIVPCHRVLASDGIGGYGGGLRVKRALLAVEGVTA